LPVYARFLGYCLILFPLTAVLRAEPYDPNIGSTIDSFLGGHGSPIAGNGSVFFTSGITNNVDPRLIVAIAGAETTFGTNWGLCSPTSYNAWSWFYNRSGANACTNSTFSSYAQGIQKVTSGIRRLYLNRNLNTIPLIGSVYCASGCGSWTPAVTTYYTALGGDTSDLTFARTLIDFEQFSGPCCFTGVQPPVTDGIATFSGGQVLDAASFLPVDRSRVYGTASFCVGCSPNIAITFSKPVSDFGVFIANGNIVTVTYTVSDDQGSIQTITLVENFNSGAGTLTLPDSNIQSVIVSGGPAPGGVAWDFLIDNVQFAPSGP
jgi:hypothetical protein